MPKKKSRSSTNKSKRVRNQSDNYKKTKRTQSNEDKKQSKRVEGEERKIHEEILNLRIGGGVAPTPEAYARALKQWQELPGSIIRPPTDVTLPPQKPKKSLKTLNDSQQTDNGSDNGERSA